MTDVKQKESLLDIMTDYYWLKSDTDISAPNFYKFYGYDTENNIFDTLPACDFVKTYNKGVEEVKLKGLLKKNKKNNKNNINTETTIYNNYLSSSMFLYLKTIAGNGNRTFIDGVKNQLINKFKEELAKVSPTENITPLFLEYILDKKSDNTDLTTAYKSLATNTVSADKVKTVRDALKELHTRPMTKLTDIITSNDEDAEISVLGHPSAIKEDEAIKKSTCSAKEKMAILTSDEGVKKSAKISEFYNAADEGDRTKILDTWAAEKGAAALLTLFRTPSDTLKGGSSKLVVKKKKIITPIKKKTTKKRSKRNIGKPIKKKTTKKHR
jgi:hypothetical protein